MAEYCNLPGEAYWSNAELLLRFTYGDPTQPDDVWSECDRCGHVGWRWDFGSLRLCQSCRASRLRAARRKAALFPPAEQDQGSEKPHKATAPPGPDDLSPDLEVQFDLLDQWAE